MNPETKTLGIKKADPKAAFARLKDRDKKPIPKWQQCADRLLYLAELQEESGMSGEITFE